MLSKRKVSYLDRFYYEKIVYALRNTFNTIGSVQVVIVIK